MKKNENKAVLYNTLTSFSDILTQQGYCLKQPFLS